MYSQLELELEDIRDRDDCYFCRFDRSDTGELIITDANAVYLTFMGISKDAFGKLSPAVFPGGYLESLIERSGFLQEDSSYCQKHLLREIGGRIWSVTLHCWRDYIVAIGRVTDASSMLEQSPAFTSSLEGSFWASILLTENKDGGFAVTSFSPHLKQSIKIRKGMLFSTLAAQSFTRLCSDALLRSCVQLGQSISHLDRIGSHADSQRPYMHLFFVPIVHNGPRQVLIRMFTISESEFFSCYTLTGAVFPELSGGEDSALCLADLRDAYTHLRFLVYNDAFAQLLETGALDEATLLNSPALTECMLNANSATCELSLPDEDGARRKYTLYAIPYMNDSHVYISLFPRAASSLSREGVWGSLTNRELEILNMVVDGYTNRYIAHTLHISEGTVKKTVYNGYQKLGISSRVELVKLANG